jgi:hypothetical protein
MLPFTATIYVILALFVACMIATIYFTIRAAQRRAPGGGQPPERPRFFQFSLGTLLLLGVPFAAGAAWIVAWKGPYKEEFLNTNAKANMFIILCDVFVNILIVRYFWLRSRRPAVSKGPIEPNPAQQPPL